MSTTEKQNVSTETNTKIAIGQYKITKMTKTNLQACEYCTQVFTYFEGPLIKVQTKGEMIYFSDYLS